MSHPKKACKLMHRLPPHKDYNEFDPFISYSHSAKIHSNCLRSFFFSFLFRLFFPFTNQSSSIEIAGAAGQWLMDSLRIISTLSEILPVGLISCQHPI